MPAKYTHIRSSKTVPGVVPRKGSRGGIPRDGTPGIRGIFSPLLVVGLLVIIFNRFGMSALSFLSPFLVESMHWEAIGLMQAISAASEIPLMFYSRKIIDRIGELHAIAIGCAGVILRFGLLALFPYKLGIVASQALHSLSYGLFHPAAMAFISSCVPPEHRALGMSLYLSIGCALPSLVGNVMGGFIVEHLGYRFFFGLYSMFPLVSLGLYGLLLFYRKRRALLKTAV
jgi:PPP family 3-phenylpropionic acid transporter